MNIYVLVGACVFILIGSLPLCYLLFSYFKTRKWKQQAIYTQAKVIECQKIITTNKVKELGQIDLYFKNIYLPIVQMTVNGKKESVASSTRSTEYNFTIGQKIKIAYLANNPKGFKIILPTDEKDDRFPVILSAVCGIPFILIGIFLLFSYASV